MLSSCAIPRRKALKFGAISNRYSPAPATVSSPIRGEATVARTKGLQLRPAQALAISSTCSIVSASPTSTSLAPPPAASRRLRLPSRYPDRTLSLTLAGTIFSVNEAAWRDAYGRLGIAAVRDAVSTEFIELGPSYRFANPEGTARFAALSAAAHRQSPTRQPSGVDVTWEALRGLQRPALLVTGEADLYAPPPLQAMVAGYIANAETHTLREVGHAAYWEKPDAFNELILSFMARHRRSTAVSHRFTRLRVHRLLRTPCHIL